jgi:hypothetical protein
MCHVTQGVDPETFKLQGQVQASWKFKQQTKTLVN